MFVEKHVLFGMHNEVCFMENFEICNKPISNIFKLFLWRIISLVTISAKSFPILTSGLKEEFYTCTDPEGGQRVQTPPPPPENHKNIG